MAAGAAAPEPIRMTVQSASADERGSTSVLQTKKGANIGWIALSALVFIGVSIWSFSWWFTPAIYYGMLLLFLSSVMGIRMSLLQKRNPSTASKDLIKNCLGSLLLVLAGIAIVMLLITLVVLVWLLTL